MAKRSKIALLPTKVREQLEQALLATNFSGYTELEAWCAEQGFQISRSAIHRFGASFESKVHAIKVATQQARAVVEASPDDDNAMNDALIRLTQDKLFSILCDVNTEDLDPGVLAKISKSVADLGRASVQQKKYIEETRAKCKAAADEVSKLAKVAGVSDDVADSMIRRILGIQQ